MNKRLTAIAVTAASLPLSALAVATPASAATACDGVYPPGQAWGLHFNPQYVKLHRNAQVTLGTRAVRDGAECPGERIGWYVRGHIQNPYVFHLSRTAYSGTGGLNYQSWTANQDFRVFAILIHNGAQVATSPPGLVQTF